MSPAPAKASGILKCQIVVFQNNEEAKQFWLHLGRTLRGDLHAFSKVLREHKSS